MKYLRIASDLHLEGFSGVAPEAQRLGFLPADDRDAESILILAGDISSKKEQLLDFLNECTKHFPRVFYVAGNHEFYRQNISTYPSEIASLINERFTKWNAFQGLEYAMEGVGYEEIPEVGVRFIFGPMWGDGGPTTFDKAITGRYLNDFRLIRKGEGYESFKVSDMEARYRDTKRQLLDYLGQPYDGKTVVITHHLPSRRLVSERFWPGDGSDGANGGFVGDCDSILARTEIAPQLWIHGHTHDTVDTHLWDTRIVCNPAGYRSEWISPFNSFMEKNDAGDRVVVPKFIALTDL